MDCKIPVRKWVLVSKPSRWELQGQRVVVQSPMQYLPAEVSHVPVKRFSREGDNRVCLIPKSDIEKDSSKIYGKMKISREISMVDAHGIAIAKSSPDDEFQYKDGDKFWIYDATTIEDYKITSTVSVINLNTLEHGVICIEQVCWFPRLRGPNEELWTLGGPVRELKLNGSKKYTFWSLAIRQPLDGKPATIGYLQIPFKGATVEGISVLSVPERRSSFAKRYQSMAAELSTDICAMPHRQRERTLSSTVNNSGTKALFSSPRPSADAGEREPAMAISTQERPSTLDIKVLKRIYAMASSQSPYSRPIHGFLAQKLVLPAISRAAQRISIDSDVCSDDDLDSTSSFEDSRTASSHTSPKYSTTAPPSQDDCSPKPEPSWDHDAASCASILLEMSREPNCSWHEEGSGLNGREPSPYYFGDTLDSISERYTREEQDPNGCLGAIRRDRSARLCNRRNPDCSYTVLHPAKHYHSPAEKCLDTHEHCVSGLLPLPADAGDCILRLKLDRHHRCCRWRAADCTDWPRSRGSEFDDPKVKEALKNGISIYNISDKVRLEEPSIDLRSFGELTESGLDLVNAFDNGFFGIDADLTRRLKEAG